MLKEFFMHSVLIIEDNESILDILKQTLTNFGHNVDTANNGKEGISKFDKGLFDLVITDIDMPGKNGNEVACYIRNSNRQQIPILGISGTPRLKQYTVFDSTLQKPFRLTTFINTVNSLFQAQG
jgi:DNA-binding response OmpR family regulator